MGDVLNLIGELDNMILTLTEEVQIIEDNPILPQSGTAYTLANKFGIGTSTPSVQLEVNGATKIDSSLTVEGTSSFTGTMIANTIDATNVNVSNMINAASIGTGELTVDNLTAYSAVTTDGSKNLSSVQLAQGYFLLGSGTSSAPLAGTLESTNKSVGISYDSATGNLNLIVNGSGGGNTFQDIVLTGGAIPTAPEIDFTGTTPTISSGNTLTIETTTAATNIVLSPTGGVNLPGLTPSLPLQLNASGNIISADISLTSNISGILPIANGGTNSGTALNNNRVMVSLAGKIVESSALTNGQFLIGSTGNAPVVGQLTSTGKTVSITNGAGTINLEVSGASSFSNITITDGGNSPAAILLTSSTGSVGQPGYLSSDAPLYLTSVGEVNIAPSNNIIDVTSSNIYKNGSQFIYSDSSNNLGVGLPVFGSLTSGTNNISLGGLTYGGLTSGTDNIAVGYKALNVNSTGYQNVGIGTSSLAANTSGFNNVSIGYQSMSKNISGVQNIAIGSSSLSNSTTGNNNIAVGYNSMTLNNGGGQNVGIGSSTLAANTTGNNNVAVGYNSLATNTTGSQNVAIGTLALNGNLIGINNIAIGYNTLALNTTGNQNIAIGSLALDNNSIGTDNIAIGYNSLTVTSTGVENIAIGTSAMTMTVGVQNVAVGYKALSVQTSGAYNTAIGTNTLQAVTTGSYNVAIGYTSGSTLVSGTYNIYLSANAATASESGTIRIGTLGNQTSSYIPGNLTVTQNTLGNAVVTTTSTYSGDNPIEIVYQNRIVTTNSTATTLQTFSVPTGTVSTTYAIESVVLGRNSVNGDSLRYNLMALFKYIVGTTTLSQVQSTTSTGSSDQPSWTVSYTYVGSSTNITLQVTGANSTNIVWHHTSRVWYTLA